MRSTCRRTSSSSCASSSRASCSTSTAGAQVENGTGSQRIVAEEVPDARVVERDRSEDRRRPATTSAGPSCYLLLAGGRAVRAALAGARAGWSSGGSARRGYDREYEQEPPSTWSRRSCRRCCARAATAGSNEFTATLFDLIRRGPLRADARHDRAQGLGRPAARRRGRPRADGGRRSVRADAFEGPVADVVDACSPAGGAALASFASGSRRTARSNSHAVHALQGQGRQAREAAPLVRNAGGRAGRSPSASLLFAVAGGVLLWPRHPRLPLGRPALERRRAWSPRALRASSMRLLCSRRPRNGAALAPPHDARPRLEAERWEAFRRYLTDFPRLQEAPPATLELWERFSSTGSRSGSPSACSRARSCTCRRSCTHASTIYWISPTGDLGSGPSRARDRRPLVGLRLGARAAVERLGRRRRRLLGRRRRRRGRRRRRVRLGRGDDLPCRRGR